MSCGLIKDWKERYSGIRKSAEQTSCGLIKDWKERYCKNM